MPGAAEPGRLLDGSVAVVTGAAAGIGEAIAERYAGEGARVVVADVQADHVRAVADRIAADGGEAYSEVVDMADVPAVRRMISRSVERLGRIDILVNNAGVTRPQSFFEVGEADWDAIHAVNARGAFFCMQSAAAHMRTQRAGRVINVASIAGKGYPTTSSIAYAASKGGLLTMTRTAASQLAPFGIAVNALCPGVTETAMVAGIIEQASSERAVTPEEVREELRASIPLGRANTPQDVADAAVFLASPLAAQITGQSLNVDGGMVFD